MKKLNVKRFLQEPSHCAIASIASLTNFYNENIDYEITKRIAKKKVSENTSDGFDSGEIWLLLNYMGFNKVTLISNNSNIFDCTWDKLGRNKLLKELKHSKNKINKDYRDESNSIYKWLKKKGFDNNIVIDYRFGKYIRKFLNTKKPLLFSFNWTMFFRQSKQCGDSPDPIKGETEEHMVTAYGYNKRGVYICDSHHQYYKYKRKKYRRGFYKISWENLMTCMGQGDVFLPEEYYIIE